MIAEKLVGGDNEMVSLQASCTRERVDGRVLAMHVRVIELDKASKVCFVVGFASFNAKDFVR